MLTIVRTEQPQLSPEAKAFFADEPRLSPLAHLVGLVASLDAACVVFALLAA